MMLLGALVALVGCDDFLDKEPQSELTEPQFFLAEADFASYSIARYNFQSVNPGQYGLGPWSFDNHTDNQASRNASSLWDPGQWKVGQGSNPWAFNQIRDCNYFFDIALPKFEEDKVRGAKDNIKHYIGEMYVLRAKAYFDKLQSIGDFPIITEALPDKEDVLLENSKRQPRNKVARFILEDLDRAIGLLLDVPPAGQRTRISKDVAILFRSRVALYEGTFEKYHKGTAFVPGGQGWPGDPADAQGFNIDSEIQFFLTEAMKSAKQIGDKYLNKLAQNTDTKEGMDVGLNSLNPYYTMFCDENMDPYPEVLFWRQYTVKAGVTHNIQMQLERNGGGSGWTRGLVNSFLMQNGLPIYAAGSGYDTEWEKEGIDATLQKRDSRIRIFTKGDNSIDYYGPNGPAYYEIDWLVKGDAETRAVTGFAMKKGKHYNANMQLYHHTGTSGYPIFRASEALLNYMEASYELNGNVDATASQYWKALRKRAKVDEDFNKTINATDVAEEAKGDFGAYSRNKLVDATLYNIRRERRNELIGEGFRWNDLQRWRACDQVKNYHIEGMRYWGSVYEGALIDANTGIDMVVVDEVGERGNMSPKTNSVYVRPYQLTQVRNRFYNGYNFTPAHYLSPLPQGVFRRASTDKGDLNTSVIYQNPGWPKIDGEGPSEVQ